jgi:histidine triad (HIT) family protein
MQDTFQVHLHVHLHVFPRYRRDGFGLHFGPQYSTLPQRKELEKVAKQLRTRLDCS